MSLKPTLRPLVAGLALAVTAATLSGCAWFRSDRPEPYMDSRLSQPLEVPPDLIQPTSAAALQIPAAPAGEAAPGEAPPSAVGPSTAFDLADDAENAFRRVGLALGRIDGASATPVVALNSYEVEYEGERFLIRLASQAESVRVDAISPEGTPVSGGAAGELLGLLRERLQ